MAGECRTDTDATTRMRQCNGQCQAPTRKVGLARRAERCTEGEGEGDARRGGEAAQIDIDARRKVSHGLKGP
jgi:hypothetical protein